MDDKTDPEFISYDDLLYKIYKPKPPFYKRIFTISFLIDTLWSCRFAVQNLWLWVRFHTYDRHHVVCIKYDKYDWGYLEPDSKLLYANAVILVDYVDRRMGYPSPYKSPYVWEDEQLLKDIYSIYHYFKFERPALIKEDEALMSCHERNISGFYKNGGKEYIPDNWNNLDRIETEIYDKDIKFMELLGKNWYKLK